ncbi:GNAT family N-acetyltransferase [Terrimonas ferruginea]|uniref:GNAT family N-acetyltransferase n=1 Tax=Terrimonas ferruginea TaxID=249 RepID=UPI0026F2D687|nr:GNAT family N-acetyltransferase [Terrimonas ferruginea]
MKIKHMIFREAKITDIRQIQIVRNSVKENTLSDPALVSDADCEEFMTRRGKGWVCEIDRAIAGFAIADLQENNIWALFVHPYYEGKGIGRELQRIMLDWYFSTGKTDVWLGTAPATKAEKFYTRSGWRRNGLHGRKEVKFEMTKEEWEKSRDVK